MCHRVAYIVQVSELMRRNRNLREAVYLLLNFSTKTFKVLLIAFALLSVSAFAQAHLSIREYHGQTVWQLPKVAEKDVDIGLWSLVIAKEFNDSIDIPKYLNQLNSFVLEIRRMLTNRTSDEDKFAAVRMFIYESGIWNGQHPFEYDLDDPLGTNLSHQLLSSYLDSRKGNCVSMPTLFYALMQRLDPSVPVCALHAPLHLFCRATDRQTGDVWNLETTNGTTARNVWYIETMDIPKKAINSGIYMRELSKKEFLAELISILVHQHREKKNFKRALRYADLALKLHPKSISNIVQKCALNAELGYPLYEKKKRGDTLTVAESKLLNEYASVSGAYDKKARSLGWRPETPEERAKYLQSLKEEKEKRTHQ